MAQSLFKLYIHIVFSTKHRQPIIYPEIEAILYSYMAGICKNLGGPAVKIGGHLNHTHILCLFPKDILFVKYIEKVKGGPSLWIKTQGEKYKNFYWQDGYGAFSVANDDVNRLSSYIENQHKRHQRESFEDEYLGILKKSGVDYDERYLWG